MRLISLPTYCVKYTCCNLGTRLQVIPNVTPSSDGQKIDGRDKNNLYLHGPYYCIRGRNVEALSLCHLAKRYFIVDDKAGQTCNIKENVTGLA